MYDVNLVSPSNTQNGQVPANYQPKTIITQTIGGKPKIGLGSCHGIVLQRLEFYSPDGGITTWGYGKADDDMLELFDPSTEISLGRSDSGQQISFGPGSDGFAFLRIVDLNDGGDTVYVLYEPTTVLKGK